MRKYDDDDPDEFSRYDDDYPPKNKYRAQRRDLMKKTKDKSRNLVKAIRSPVCITTKSISNT